jgi:hypothetical protein
MINELFNRAFSLNIGGIPIETQLSDISQPEKTEPTLKVGFDIVRNLNKDPNTAYVSVYDLNYMNRALLQEGSDLVDTFRSVNKLYDWPLVIEAGYVGSKEVLFTGNITYATSRREGVDWVTDIECEDGGNKYRNKRMNQSYQPGATVLSVATQAAALLDLGPGNLIDKLGVGVFRKGYSVFTQGFVASGRVSDVLDQLLSSAGFTWSIQDGNLLILGPTETALEEVVVLSQKTGLIGSPEKGEKGILTAKSLLQGKLKPGRRIVMDSELVTGQYKIERVEHFGDTWGTDWYSEVEAKPI